MRRYGKKITKFDIFASLALVSLFFVILSGIIAPKEEGEADTVTLTVRATGVSEALAEELLSSDAFTLDNRYALSVVSRSAEGAKLLISADGVIKEAESTVKKTVTLTLTASGRMTEAGFLIGRIRFLAPNMDITISSLSAEVSVKILDIRENSPTFAD
ncbi:MAG: DUF4330 family protein [Clostridia bacterium]|nr:DUF4330 family protein [Clostridia bacterium]MBQ8720127.1 DUF4330 family protein [Clostridia bacterium]